MRETAYARAVSSVMARTARIESFGRPTVPAAMATVRRARFRGDSSGDDASIKAARAALEG